MAITRASLPQSIGGVIDTIAKGAAALGPLFGRGAIVGGGIAAGGAAISALGSVFGDGGGGWDREDGHWVQRNKRGKWQRVMTPSGKIVDLRRRRRGISATELRGFKKVANLLGRVGMKPIMRSRGRKRA